MTAIKPFITRLTLQQWQHIKKTSIEHGLTMNNYVRQLIDEDIKKKERNNIKK